MDSPVADILTQCKEDAGGNQSLLVPEHFGCNILVTIVLV